MTDLYSYLLKSQMRNDRNRFVSGVRGIEVVMSSGMLVARGTGSTGVSFLLGVGVGFMCTV